MANASLHASLGTALESTYPGPMLFECWSQLVASHPTRMALRRDDGSTLTFAELDQQARAMVNDRADGLWVARGGSPDFLATILAAWRNDEAVILSEGEPREIRSAIPPGTRLIKQSCGAAGLERSLFFSSEAILAEAKRNVIGLGLHPERSGLAALSLAHSYGFGCLALPLLLHGVPVTIIASPLPAFLEEALASGEPSFLPGVPTMWKTWWQTGVTGRRAIDLAISAGAPLSKKLEALWFQHQKTLFS
jgi:acyl-CoA synthetase (AMP-forming)/AMP-acid ligase II